jgi:hypothetical protein
MKFFDDLIIASCVVSVATLWVTSRTPRIATAPTQAATAPITAHRLDLDPTIDRWFASPNSIGAVAIGMAEGNYWLQIASSPTGQRVVVKTTRLYAGHVDPGNFVQNYGFCSDQGRSGGDLPKADQGCLERIRSKIPEAIADLRSAGIDPIADPEALFNTLDLHNQGSPIHSRWFPRSLAKARAARNQGIETIAHARTAAFYQNGDPTTGHNLAIGLLGICRRENRRVSDFACVYGDQLRRAREISKAIRIFGQAGTTEGERE